MTWFDYATIILFFGLIVYFGYLFRQVSGTTRKFFLADRALPGWLAGITFISGNVSAMEILGLAGGGFVYGLVFAQYAWVGAIPAIVFLSLVLVPYYYRARIFNLLEFTGRRYGASTRLFHSLLMLSYMLLALGTGLYAFSLALDVMFGLPLWMSIGASALVLGVVTAAGGIAKLAVPLITVIPGMTASVLLPDLETPDTAVFELILRYYPTGLAGVAFISVLAGFTAMNTGMTMGLANIFTRNVYRHHIRPGASDEHYVRASRAATVGALLLGVLTAFIAAQFSVFYVWMQEYNIFVIVPLLAVLLLGLFWARTTAIGASTGLLAGSVSAVAAFVVVGAGDYLLWRASATLAVSVVVTVALSLATRPAARETLTGVLWGTLPVSEEEDQAGRWARPLPLALVLLAVTTVLVTVFA